MPQCHLYCTSALCIAAMSLAMFQTSSLRFNSVDQCVLKRRVVMRIQDGHVYRLAHPGTNKQPDMLTTGYVSMSSS